ncbi:hypothetical protein SAMD00024442_197_2 [Candidatus Symbiothrix dinenymphae]|nr:hypothetical protein SAMD00024442_197_2 [Candidatus Symbiothrix dinenymphae]
MEHFSLFKTFPNGGYVEIIDGYSQKSDHDDLLAIALFFARQGHIVQITTSIYCDDPKYSQVFGALIGTVYERKCPDLIIDGEFYEYESYMPPFKKEKISHMLSQGLKQSPRIIINNNGGAKDYFIQKFIRNRIYEKNFVYNIVEVWVFEAGSVRILYKQQ